MENLKKALQALGFTSTQLAELEKDDAKVDDIVGSFKSDQESLFWSKSGKEKLEKEMSEKFTVFQNTTKQKINKLLGMGKTRSELDPVDFEEFIKEGESYIKDKIDSATKQSDESIKAELNETKTKFADLLNRYDNEKQEWTTKISETENTWKNKLEQQQVELSFKTAASKLDFYDKERAGTFERLLRMQIDDNYILKPDGTLTAKDGSVATSPDGKIVFESINSNDPEKNPLLFFATKDNLLKKSNGGEGGGGGEGGPGGGENKRKPGTFTGRAAQMQKEFEARSKK